MQVYIISYTIDPLILHSICYLSSYIKSLWKLFEQLVQAASSGNLSTIRHLLTNSLTAPPPETIQNAVQETILNSQTGIDHYLLNEHFPSIPVSEEAIRSSCYTGSLAIAEAICAKEPHAYTGGFGEKGTPISFAIQSHQPYKFLSFLLAQGADPYLSSGRFAPVLPAAVVCYRGSVDANAALVDHGIDLNIGISFSL